MIEAPPAPEEATLPAPAVEPEVPRPEPVEEPPEKPAEEPAEKPVEELPSPCHPRNRIKLFAVLVTALCLAFGGLYGVKAFLRNATPAQPEKTTETKVPGEAPGQAEAMISSVEDILDTPEKEAAEPNDAGEDVLVPEIEGTDGDLPPEPEPTDPEPAEPEPAEPEPAEPEPAEPAGPAEPAPAVIRAVDGGIEALALLEDFLAMKTLGERIPHTESKREESDLAASVLGGMLPEVMKISVDVCETNTVGQFVDYYYLVDFARTDGGVDPQTLLVRSRGAAAPKVVVDPFLDLFGGRFARYAEKPTEGEGTFQVIISAGAFCHDDVPSPEGKYTLKILSREDTPEIARAYFGKNSRIGDMLEDETSGLAYGQAKPCTVVMRWNMEEDPDKPFLEALDIRALNWNP